MVQKWQDTACSRHGLCVPRLFAATGLYQNADVPFEGMGVAKYGSAHAGRIGLKNQNQVLRRPSCLGGGKQA